MLALDFLRLIAAVFVFLSHFVSIFRFYPQFSGLPAVVLFFVLSGYVLTISVNRAAPSLKNYFNFVIKRVFRIYPLYWAALLFTFVVLVWIKSSGGFVKQVGMPVSFLEDDHMGWNQWLKHIVLVAPGMYSEFANPPVWTLMIEAKVGVVFPLLAWVLMRAQREISCVTLAALVLGSDFLHKHDISRIGEFLGMFGIGALLARVPFTSWRVISSRVWGALFVMSALLLGSICFKFTALSRLQGFNLSAFGAAGLIICSIHWEPLRLSLEKLQRYLKIDVSYSIYILHYPILIGLCKFVNDGILPLSMLTLLIISIVVTGSISLALSLFVEIPAIKIGAFLSRKLM